MKRIERNVVEIDYVCEICGRKSGSESVIERCETLHKNPNCQHTWWKDSLNSLYFYETAASLLEAANNVVTMEGDYGYDIYVEDSNTVFYLDSFESKDEALCICKELGWEII